MDESWNTANGGKVRILPGEYEVGWPAEPFSVPVRTGPLTPGGTVTGQTPFGFQQPFRAPGIGGNINIGFGGPQQNIITQIRQATPARGVHPSIRSAPRPTARGAGPVPGLVRPTPSPLQPAMPALNFDLFSLLNFLANASFLVGVGASAVAITGAEASGGIVFNPGLSDQQADIGVFGSIGAGGGVNVSGDIFVGVVRGGIENVSGQTLNINLTFGGPQGIGPSVTLFIDPTTRQVIGGTVGIGPGTPPIGASATLSQTGTLTIRDLLRSIVSGVPLPLPTR